MIEVRPLGEDDAAWKAQSLEATWGTAQVARKGELIDPLALDGFIALLEGRRAGLLAIAVAGDEVEVVSLHADRPRHGIGRALMDAAHARAVAVNARRLWLITTNDNTNAIRFYQRWGMDLAALHRDGVTRARLLKPAIPLVGNDGIPIRHELELELQLGA